MSEWRDTTLGDICKINMGQSPKSEHYNYEKQGLPFLQGNRTFGAKYPTFDTYTNISLQIAAGVPLKTVSARAGHSNTKVTADIYAHMIQSSDRAAADKLGEILG